MRIVELPKTSVSSPAMSPIASAPPATGRLTPAQVDHFKADGYVIFDQPVLPAPRFTALGAYFEQILADLSPGDRPEAMDVPHFVYPKLFEWALAPEILGLV